MIYRLTDAKTPYLMDLLRIIADQNLTQVERIRRGLSGGEHAPEPVSRADLVAQIEQFLPTPAQDAAITPRG